MFKQRLDSPLRRGVCEAIFSPTDTPLTEEALAERFGVSRTPIREILRDLQRHGVIERRQKKGVSVRKPSPKELSEVYDVRAILEGHAARLAAANATRNDIRELNALAGKFIQGRKSGDTQSRDEANIAFHTKIITVAGNSFLQSMMGQFGIIRKAFCLSHDLSWDERDYMSPYPHEAIVEKLAAGDTEGCDELMQAHIRHGRNLLIEKALGLNLSISNES